MPPSSKNGRKLVTNCGGAAVDDNYLTGGVFAVLAEQISGHAGDLLRVGQTAGGNAGGGATGAGTGCTGTAGPG